MKKILSALLLTGGWALSAAASAAVINGTIGTFDGDGDGAADDSRIARITFSVTAGTRIFFDSLVLEARGSDLNGDGLITGYDNYMVLYGTSMQYLTGSDDSSSTYGDGSISRYDSAIDYTFATAGTYMVTMGQLSYLVAEGAQGYQANRRYAGYFGESEGAWRLTMTPTGGVLSNVREVRAEDANVPEPGSLVLLGAGLLGVAAARRRAAKGSARA